jgi:hypothetical protein
MLIEEDLIAREALAELRFELLRNEGEKESLVPLHLPCISTAPPLYLHCTSPASPLHLASR